MGGGGQMSVTGGTIFSTGGTIDQLHVVGIYHVLKAHNFPEFLGYVI